VHALYSPLNAARRDSMFLRLLVEVRVCRLLCGGLLWHATSSLARLVLSVIFLLVSSLCSMFSFAVSTIDYPVKGILAYRLKQTQ